MKKFLAMLLAMAMALSLCVTASAEADLSGEYNVTIWVAENIVELTLQQIEDFNDENEDGIVIHATVEPVSEADAARR